MGDHDLGPCHDFGRFFVTIFRWKSSCYRLVWKEFVFFTAAYFSISLMYDFALSDDMRKEFEAVADLCYKYTSTVPIVLLLGFFTSTAMQRWFSLITALPGTFNVVACFVLTLREAQPEGMQLVKTYSRWVILSWILTFRMICSPLKKMYPDLVSLQQAGFLLMHERLELEGASGDVVPLKVIDWCLALLQQSNRNDGFRNPVDYNRNVDALLGLKKACGNTLKFAAKNIPFALTQAVTVVVFVFGFASLMIRHQMTISNNRVAVIITGYVPVLNIFQYFLFYLWMKIGRMAANPFGKDEGDFDIIRLVHCHIEDARRLIDLYKGFNNGGETPTQSVLAASVHTDSVLWAVTAVGEQSHATSDTVLYQAAGDDTESELSVSSKAVLPVGKKSLLIQRTFLPF